MSALHFCSDKGLVSVQDARISNSHDVSTYVSIYCLLGFVKYHLCGVYTRHIYRAKSINFTLLQ